MPYLESSCLGGGGGKVHEKTSYGHVGVKFCIFEEDNTGMCGLKMFGINVFVSMFIDIKHSLGNLGRTLLDTWRDIFKLLLGKCPDDVAPNEMGEFWGYFCKWCVHNKRLKAKIG